MMKCEKIKKILPEYSVGGLSNRKRKLIKKHVDNCPDCSRELILLDKTALLLDSIPQEEPPDFLWEGVKIGIIQQKRHELWTFLHGIVEWFWGKRIIALTAGLTILILVLGLYFTIWRSPVEPQSELYTETEYHTLSYWNTSFADKAALGMIVIKTSMEGENMEGENK